MARGRLIRHLPRASTLDEIRALMRTPVAQVEGGLPMPLPASRSIRLPRAAPLIVVDARRAGSADPVDIIGPARSGLTRTA